MTNRVKWIIVAFLIVTCGAVMYWKVAVLGFHPSQIIPAQGYNVHIDASVKGYGSGINIQTYLPKTSNRQYVLEERNESELFAFTVQEQDGNRVASWSAEGVDGEARLRYSFAVQTMKEEFKLPDYLIYTPSDAKKYQRYLEATPLIQKDAPEVELLAEQLGIDTLNNLVEMVQRVYTYTHKGIAKTKFSGETDALVTLKLREASCNGKSRLAVALLRSLNIPSRLVGGVILKKGRKKTSHQWVEVLMAGSWVPFDPLNGHLFYTPKNYLVLYHGDYAMFTRTAHVKFNYAYDIDTKMMNRSESSKQVALLNVWGFLSSANVETGILGVLLMIPFGALITVLFRNMIGLETFGTFLPALIATSYKDTGLLWGTVGFIALVMCGVAMRAVLNKMKLLHTPRLTIILVIVILMMLGLTLFGVSMGIKELSQAALFPIAILAITIERFSVIAEEQGIFNTMKIFFNTVIVVTFCYLGMMSLFLQTVVLAFPEVLLVVIAISIYLGRWTGIRLTELIRFRHLIREGEGKI